MTIDYDIYLDFIESCRKSTGTVKHHIVPRAFGGTDSPNNIIKLTTYEHATAHYLIAKSLPLGSVERRKMIYAFRSCISSVMKQLHKQ